MESSSVVRAGPSKTAPHLSYSFGPRGDDADGAPVHLRDACSLHIAGKVIAAELGHAGEGIGS